MTQSVDPFLELEGCKRVLRDGLGLLESRASAEADQEDAGRLAAWEKIVHMLQSGPSPDALRAQVPADRLDEFDDALEEVLSLNAVLVSAVASEKDQILGKLRTVREVRRGMAYYQAAAPEGDRCDISG